MRKQGSSATGAAAVNCRIHKPDNYEILTPPPARRKAPNPMFVVNGNFRSLIHSTGSGERCMTDRPTDNFSFPTHRPPRGSLLAARKLALMGSVLAGLGVAIYGFGPGHGSADWLSSAAHAQVNNEVRKVAQPIGFADIV